nr:hypothetical protein [Sphingomonadaceae bacterium]
SNMEIGGGYLGSTASPFSIDFYSCAGVSIHGVSVGGTTAAFVGVNTCTNFNVEGCQHIHGLATFDYWPASGHGYIADNFGTFYQIGARIKSTTPNRTFAGATDTVLDGDGSGNVTGTNAGATTVTVPTLAIGTVVTYEQGGAGALSFAASGVTIQTAIAGGGATNGQYQTRTLFYKSATVVRIT